MKNRIKEIIDKKGETMYSFGKKNNLSPQRIYNWTKIKEKPSDLLDLTIKHYLKVNKYIW